MVTIAFILAVLVVSMVAYSIPGLYLARGLYVEAKKELNSNPVQIVPPMPARPKFKTGELLHDSGKTLHGNRASTPRCSLLDGASACTCQGRENWADNREQWRLYNEWQSKYGNIKNGSSIEPVVNMTPIYWAVPGWPVVAASRFIKGGAKNIPDYRAIERMENELKEL